MAARSPDRPAPGSSDMKPEPLGLKKSFGFGDRLGLATPGHVEAVKGTNFAPIFAQQSIRELTRTGRTAAEVMRAAVRDLRSLVWDQPWGADADHLKTPHDVEITARAGFTFFTIDPSEYVVNSADRMDEAALNTHVESMERDGVLRDGWAEPYLGRAFDLGNTTMAIAERQLRAAAVKYGRALHHCEAMAKRIAECRSDGPFEVEVSVDETDSPTSPEEHLFVGLELKRRAVPIVSLAPRFTGDFEKGIDYRGDLDAFEREIGLHVAVAKRCGPYKISLHSGSDKFSVYPIVGRLCGDLLHVKTAGTSYLEALRVVARSAPGLFREIAAYAQGRFAEDRVSYHISTTDAEVAALGPAQGSEAEEVYLDRRPGRQLLHVTFGSVLAHGSTERGRPFREAILELLHRQEDLHREVLQRHLGEHLRLLNSG